MDKKSFDDIRALVYEKSGIKLSEAKKSLVVARLTKRMRALSLPDAATYVQYLNEDETGEEMVQMLDAISTNVTHFFRENQHFEFLKTAVEKWLGQGQGKFRYWSAASSTGEEPYSLAITLQEIMKSSGRSVDMKILATDISTRVLQHCKAGQYGASEVDKVPPMLRSRYFKKMDQAEQSVYQVVPKLRNMVKFVRLNLSAPPFPMKGPLDFVFCRNVMIYFDQETRLRLLNEIYKLLKPGGYLVVGHAESLTGDLMGNYVRVAPATYAKPE